MSDSRTIPEGDKEDAGVLIGVALKKHYEVLGNDRAKLEAAIAAGKALLQARNVYSHDEAGKRQWGKKLKECWKPTSTRTAYRYMDIAKHEDIVRADFDTRVKFEGKEAEVVHWSIRSALDLIAKTNGGEEQDQPKGAKVAAVVTAIKAEPAPDVITKAIKDLKLPAADRREIARALDDTPVDLVEEAKSIISKLDLTALNGIADYIANLIEQREKVAA
jgi:hypothetical protein